jgi:hypothetical protein
MDGYPTPAIHGASFGAAQQGAPGFGPQVPQHDQRLGRRLEPRLGSVDGSWMDNIDMGMDQNPIIHIYIYIRFRFSATSNRSKPKRRFGICRRGRSRRVHAAALSSAGTGLASISFAFKAPLLRFTSIWTSLLAAVRLCHCVQFLAIGFISISFGQSFGDGFTNSLP